MKVLHLVLKKQWFDLIASGEKKEEYRDITPHWEARLIDEFKQPKYFDVVCFQHGYAKDAPRFHVECKGIEVKEGRTEWGAMPGVKYYTIGLGEMVLVDKQS